MRVPWTTSESDTAAVACSISSPRLCNRFSVTLQCWLAMLAGCSTTANPVCHCTRRTAGDQDMTDSVTVENGVAYANHDGVELVGDLYLPQAAKYLPKPPKPVPALVAVHGGGWVAGARGAFQYWGPYLAARGIAVFAIFYRLATKTKSFPEAVQDVLAGVQFVRGKAHAFGIDPARIGLLGASAGAHLAALAALSGKKFLGAYPQDSFAATGTSVKALVGVYGVYDLYAMWCSLQVQDGRNSDNKVEKFIGAPPMASRQTCFDASPISYATYSNNSIGLLPATGTNDEIVDPK